VVGQHAGVLGALPGPDQSNAPRDPLGHHDGQLHLKASVKAPNRIKSPQR